MVTCPTCQVMLRVPPAADTIRCPQCKTVLQLQPAVAAPVSPPPPPPPPAKPAIPLPFGRPPEPPPAVARRPEPAPTRGGKVTRGKVVEEEEEDSPEAKRPRRRGPTDEEKFERLLEKVGAEARPARTGIQLMAYGAVAAAPGQFFASVFFFSTLLLHSGNNPVLWVPIIGVIVHWLLTIVGFGFCCFGPKEMRHMAVAGLIVMLVHVVSMIGLLQLTARHISLDIVGFEGLNNENSLLGSLLLANLFSNISGVTNLPLIIMHAMQTFPVHVFVLIMFSGGIEFAKLSLIGTLANHYAVEGKSPELGHQSMRFVYRIIWVVLIGLVCELIMIGVASMGFGFVFLSLPTLMLINAYYMWCAFAWAAQFQVLLEVADVITPERFVDKRANLDTLYY
ncbi:zinc finger domain-containing protein [Limnoglobus roseus]|nr:hypothetical protein [Limnoglobus roseus]